LIFPTVRNLKFSKIQDGSGCHFGKSKNRQVSGAV